MASSVMNLASSCGTTAAYHCNLPNNNNRTTSTKNTLNQQQQPLSGPNGSSSMHHHHFTSLSSNNHNNNTLAHTHCTNINNNNNNSTNFDHLSITSNLSSSDQVLINQTTSPHHHPPQLHYQSAVISNSSLPKASFSNPILQQQQISNTSTGQIGFQTTPSSSDSSLQSISNFNPTLIVQHQQLNNGRLLPSSLSELNNTKDYCNRLAPVNNVRGKPTILQLNSGRIVNSGYKNLANSETISLGMMVANTENVTSPTPCSSATHLHNLQLNPQHSKMWISQPTLGARHQRQTGSQIRSMMNLNYI